jgi:hypothetical protein
MEYPFACIAGLIKDEHLRDRFARGFTSNRDNIFATLRNWADRLSREIVFGV